MNKQFDRYSSLFFAILGLGFVYESQFISKSSYGSNVGPDIFPLGLGLVLCILSLRLFYETFRYKQEKKAGTSFDVKRFSGILAVFVLYALTLEALGYVISTFLFLFIAFQLMERGNLGKTAMVAGIFSGGVYYVFVNVLEGSLPGFPEWLIG